MTRSISMFYVVFAMQLIATTTRADTVDDRFAAAQRTADPALNTVLAKMASEAQTRLAQSGLVEAIKERSPSVDKAARQHADVQRALSANFAAMRTDPSKMLELLQTESKLIVERDEAWKKLQNARSSYEIHIRELLEKQWDNLAEPRGSGLAGDARPSTIPEVQAVIRPDEALIVYSSPSGASSDSKRPLSAWFITKDVVRERQIAADVRSIAQRVDLLRCGLDETAWYPGASAESQQAARSAACQSAFPEGPITVDGKIVLPFDNSIAHSLYVDLLSNEERLLAGKKLFIVGFGPLNKLPFHVLLTSPAGDDSVAPAWLFRRHPIATLPSVSWLAETRSKQGLGVATRPYLGFANPELDGPDNRFLTQAALSRDLYSCDRVTELSDKIKRRGSALRAVKRTSSGELRVADLMRLTPLPESAYEACESGKFLGAYPDEILVGGQASESHVERLRYDLLRYKIIHFATHGLPTRTFVRDPGPGLVLSPKVGCGACEYADELVEYKPSGRGWRKLETEGFLSATEIASIPLDADLVILSACNTATPSQEAEEAFSGLARAFLEAGARSVLASHWEVDSQATVKLITRFVSLTNSGARSPAEALQGSMLELADGSGEHYSHPSYWAPFVLIGGSSVFATAEFKLLTEQEPKPSNENQSKLTRDVVVMRSDEQLPIAVAPKVGQAFRECEHCPEMVGLSAGTFLMGSPASEVFRDEREGLPRSVAIEQPFAVGKYELRADEWQACVADGGCEPNIAYPYEEQFAKRPAVHTSWTQITEQYLPWINRKLALSGPDAYRLLTEAEWEYAARAGTTTPFSTGDTITTEQANFDGETPYADGAPGIKRWRAVDVGSFAPNKFGLHDMHGNVSEWVQDCYREASDEKECERVTRGGHWADTPSYLRSANRMAFHPILSSEYTGFRVARTLPAR